MNCEVIKMKTNIGAYIAGGMSVLGIWLVYENKQKELEIINPFIY